MTHYDLKQQEKQQWRFGGWAGAGGVTNIFVIYLRGGGSSMFFQRDGGGGGVVKMFAYHMKM